MSPAHSNAHMQDTIDVHATTVALAGRAAMLRGPSGSGKSGLALQLIALGAVLVADDRTTLVRDEGGLIAMAPQSFENRIEARFFGILAVPGASSAPLAVIVDMSQEETERLPVARHETVLGHEVPIIRKSIAPHFPAALALYLQGGRLDPDS